MQIRYHLSYMWNIIMHLFKIPKSRYKVLFNSELTNLGILHISNLISHLFIDVWSLSSNIFMINKWQNWVEYLNTYHTAFVTSLKCWWKLFYLLWLSWYYYSGHYLVLILFILIIFLSWRIWYFINGSNLLHSMLH